jgi:hypothetical protein
MAPQQQGWYPQAAGPQEPHRYKQTGPNYLKFGEQPGWRYYEWNDQYYPDPNAQRDWAIQNGYAEPPPKEPSLTDTLLPIGAAGLAVAAGSGLGKNPGEFIGGLIGGGRDLIKGAGSVISDASGLVTDSGILGSAAEAAPVATQGMGLISGVGPVADGATYASGIQGATPAAGGMGLLGTAGAIAGGAAGAYGMYDLLKKPETSELRGATQGAASGAALGASLGSVIPGAGTVIGGAVGGIAGGLIGLGHSLFGSKNKWKTEKNNLNELKESGVYIPDNLLASMPTKGRSKDELIDKSVAPDFVGMKPDGTWVNNKFAQSRNVADLKPEDIVNYSAFAENDPDWFKKPLDQRLGVAGQALQNGAVKEGHGTITVDWGKMNSIPSTPVVGQVGKSAAMGPSAMPRMNPAPTVPAQAPTRLNVPTPSAAPAPTTTSPRSAYFQNKSKQIGDKVRRF